MSEHWRNAADVGILKYSGEMPVQCHFIYHKSHTDWHDFQLGLPWREAGE